MTSRGAAVSYDATQFELDDYTHNPEPQAAFVEALSYDATETDPVADVDYTHPFDGPSGSSDFGDLFTVDGSGTGWYMTPADTADKSLQGAPNARSTATGVLAVEIALAASAAGLAGVPAPTMLKDVPLDGTSSGVGSFAGNLKNVKDLAAAIATSSTVGVPRFGFLGAYEAAILADSPKVYARLSETTGGAVAYGYNHPSLPHPNEQVWSFSTTYNARSRRSLVETQDAGSVRMFQAPNNSFMQAQAAAWPTPSPDWSHEFWYSTTWADTTWGESQLLYASVFSAGSGGSEVATLFLQTDGTLRAARGSSGMAGYIGITGTRMVNDGLPHHIVLTYDHNGNGRLSLYIDGLLEASDESFAPQPRGPGSGYGTSWNTPALISPYAGGYVDELAWYTATLSPGQVATHYAAASFDLLLVGPACGVATITPPNLDAAPAGVALTLDGSAAGLATQAADLTLPIVVDLGSVSVVAVAGLTADLTIRLRFVPNVASDQTVRDLRRIFT